MRQEAARLTFLVQDLITLSRIQAAEPVPDPRPVPVDAIVAEALDRCRMKANARGITLASIGGKEHFGIADDCHQGVAEIVHHAVGHLGKGTPAFLMKHLALRRLKIIKRVLQPGG